MVVRDLDESDQTVARLCVEAVLASTVVPEEEYESRIGCDRHRLEAIIREWPPGGDGVEGSEEFGAINNCLGQVAYCPDEDPWESELHRHVTRDEAERVFRRWRRSVGLTDPAEGIRE